MRKIIIGLVYSELAPIPKFDHILSDYADVRLLRHDTVEPKLEMVVIPPCVGIYPTIARMRGISYTPICPRVEYFRTKTIFSYEELDIPIVAFGEFAAVLYDRIGGDSVAVSRGVLLLHNPKLPIDIVGSADEFIDGFATEKFYGVTSRVELFTSVIRNLSVEKYKQATDTTKDGEEPEFIV